MSEILNGTMTFLLTALVTGCLFVSMGHTADLPAQKEAIQGTETPAVQVDRIGTVIKGLLKAENYPPLLEQAAKLEKILAERANYSHIPSWHKTEKAAALLTATCYRYNNRFLNALEYYFFKGKISYQSYSNEITPDIWDYIIWLISKKDFTFKVLKDTGYDDNRKAEIIYELAFLLDLKGYHPAAQRLLLFIEKHYGKLKAISITEPNQYSVGGSALYGISQLAMGEERVERDSVAENKLLPKEDVLLRLAEEYPDVRITSLWRGDGTFIGPGKAVALYELMGLYCSGKENEKAFDHMKELLADYEGAAVDCWEWSGTFGDLCAQPRNYDDDEGDLDYRKKALAYVIDNAILPKTRSTALYNLGYLFREGQNMKKAEYYFGILEKEYPHQYEMDPFEDGIDSPAVKGLKLLKESALQKGQTALAAQYKTRILAVMDALAAHLEKRIASQDTEECGINNENWRLYLTNDLKVLKKQRQEMKEEK